jgi:hypothetical protein
MDIIKYLCSLIAVLLFFLFLVQVDESPEVTGQDDSCAKTLVEE